MKNQQLFNRTHQILTEAYLNDTLEHGNYCGCAVGNLVAAAQNRGIYRTPLGVKWERGNGSGWFNLVATPHLVRFISHAEREAAEAQVDSTGYSIEQLQLIEEAFECGAGDAMAELQDPQFGGLVAVFEVLSNIHELNSTDKEEVNSMFYENKFALSI